MSKSAKLAAANVNQFKQCRFEVMMLWSGTERFEYWVVSAVTLETR